tara:strand:+ start:883 stop:2034 length:1152 start_codon:yes stop_codon:yes gene_type:complete
MALYKFGPNDIFHNRIKTLPESNFYIYSDKIYYKKFHEISGTLNSVANINHVDVGFLSLYELNVDRPTGELIYPFVTKQGSLTTFKTITVDAFQSNSLYGDSLDGAYPLSASIYIDNYDGNLIDSSSHLATLRNTLNFHSKLSPHYQYSSSLGDKSQQELRLISIPSIFYGSSIEKGSVDLKFYVSGTLIARAQDRNRNGEIVQTEPSGNVNTGSVAGVVLYDEGFLILTGTWDLSTETADYRLNGSDLNPSWRFFGTTSSTLQRESFSLDFRGVNYIPTVTMLAHANKGELNHSNNPSFVRVGQTRTALTTSFEYKEPENLQIKNIVSSSHTEHTASFQKHTYISKIGVYDEDKNLIAIAKLATPVKKTENREFTFKLKLDF